MDVKNLMNKNQYSILDRTILMQDGFLEIDMVLTELTMVGYLSDGGYHPPPGVPGVHRATGSRRGRRRPGGACWARRRRRRSPTWVESKGRGAAGFEKGESRRNDFNIYIYILCTYIYIYILYTIICIYIYIHNTYYIYIYTLYIFKGHATGNA